MSKVYNLAHRLADALKNSEQYQRYKEIREKVMEDERQKEMLKDYQEKQIQIQAKRMRGEDVSEEEEKNLKKLQELVEMNANIKEYLQAEYQFNMLLNDLQKILFGDLEFGLEEENKEE